MGKLQHTVVELPHSGVGPPVFVIKVPRRSDVSKAPCVMVYGTVERSKIVESKLTLITNLVFAIDPELPEEERVILIMTPSSTLPEQLAPHATYLGAHLHPQGGFPICVYELPSEEVAAFDAAVEEAAKRATSSAPVDVLAALQNVQQAQTAQEGESNDE